MRPKFILAIALLAAASGAAKKSHADIPIPIPSVHPVALYKLRVNNPDVFPLTGTWRFQLARGAMERNGYHSSASGPVSASSFQDGHPPMGALTGNIADSRWCASDESMPQWWQADLGTVRDLAAVNITWEFQDATYQYKLDTSDDGKKWRTIRDHSTAPGVGGGRNVVSVSCRFLRITVLGARRTGATAWASIKYVGIEMGNGGRGTVVWKAPRPVQESPEKRDAFASTSLNDASWSTIAVPWNWEMSGFSKPTYDNPDDAIGLYRRFVSIPVAFTGKTIIWHFEGVWDSAEIFINGKRAGYHESGFTAFDMDVTKYLHPSTRNLLAIRVCKTTPSDDLDTGDYWSLGGIYRDTYLVAVNPSHVRNIKIVTHLDSQYKNATLGISVGVTQAAPGEIKLHGELFHADRSPAGIAMDCHADVPNEAGGVMQLRADVPRPLLWSAEKPNLYYAVLTLSVDGKVVERVQERFGFREIQFRNGVVLWNGVPIKCTGTCRHEEWAALGHALNETAWRTDLKLMKGCNINAVRTSHYNHAGRFLELCDEVGIYVLDEVPACWCNLSDPKLKDAFVQRTKETLDRDENKPCVLAWSLANESGYGPNAAAMLQYVKANDPTRPAFVSQCGPWNNPLIDFVDTHYPSIEEVKRLAADPMRKITPVVMTEQPHIFYVSDGLTYDFGEKDYWGQVLASNWSVVWPTDSILGSFIWEWQDQGIADKFPDSGRDSYGLRDNNHKGIVDGYRNVKPEYWNIKMVYSPVTIGARETSITDGVCAVSLQNRYSFTDLADLTCKWQAISGQTVINSGVMHIACAPRSTTTANFPAATGMDTIRIEFIHPDGRSIYSARLHIQGAPVLPAAPANDSNGTTSASETLDKNTVSGAGSELTVDHKTGAIIAWRVDGADLLSGSPILNLGEHRANHGDHGATNFVESKQSPLIQNTEVSSSINLGNPVIVVRGLVRLVEQSEPSGRIEIRYEMRPNGDLAVEWNLAWAGNGVNCWELGLKLPINTSFENMTWARDGLWTDYPADHIGALTGSAKPADLTFRCTKRDVRWVRMADAHGAGVCAIPQDTPLHTRAMREGAGITLFLSCAISPPYDFSTNLLPDKLIHLSHGEHVGGEFLLRPVGGK